MDVLGRWLSSLTDMRSAADPKANAGKKVKESERRFKEAIGFRGKKCFTWRDTCKHGLEAKESRWGDGMARKQRGRANVP